MNSNIVTFKSLVLPNTCMRTHTGEKHMNADSVAKSLVILVAMIIIVVLLVYRW